MLPFLTQGENIFIFLKGVLSSFLDLECSPEETRFAGESTASRMDFKDLRFPEVINLRSKKEVGGGEEREEPDGV